MLKPEDLVIILIFVSLVNGRFVFGRSPTDTYEQFHSNESEEASAIRILAQEVLPCQLDQYSCEKRPANCPYCSCDPDCVHYGDCCYDFTLPLAEETEYLHYPMDRGAIGSTPTRYSCAVLDMGTNQGVLMVSSCLHLYEGSDWEKQCNQVETSSAYNYMMDLPVISSQTNTIYLNFYCALCNDDGENIYNVNLAPSCTNNKALKTFDLSENSTDLAEYYPGHRRWVIRTNDPKGRAMTSTCILQAFEYLNVSESLPTVKLRECLYPRGICWRVIRYKPNCEGEIRYCSPFWEDKEVERLCEFYSMPIVHGKDVYKNLHCALCNYVNLTSNTKPLNCVINDKCNGRTPTRVTPPRSLSVLMDFSSKSCTEEEIYDPLSKKCVKVRCGQLYYLNNKKCIRRENKKQNSKLLDDSCLKNLIPNTDFSFLSDESVYVNSSGKVFSTGEYELNNDSQILICSEKLNRLSMIMTRHRWTTLIVLSLSIVCLVLHILVYFILPKMRNLPGKILVSLSGTLLISHTLFLVEGYAVHIQKLCFFIGVTLHFFYLSSFCWMNVMSFDVFTTFRGNTHRAPDKNGKIYTFYSIFCLVIPSIIVLSSMVIEFSQLLPNFKPNYAGKICWIDGENSLMVFFVIPAGFVFFMNIIFFVITAHGIRKQTLATKFAMKRSQSTKECHTKKKSNLGMTKKVAHKEQTRFLLYVKLAIIQGLTWTTGFVAILTGLPVSWFIFILLNGLQGVFIFVFFDLKKKVRYSVWDKVSTNGFFRSFKDSSQSTLTTSTSSGRKTSSKYSWRTSVKEIFVDKKPKTKEKTSGGSLPGEEGVDFDPSVHDNETKARKLNSKAI